MFSLSPLGELSALRVYHDNSGVDKMASWYLKFIIVHDLQTREMNYFICEKWFALDKEDTLIDRLIPVCGKKQKTEFKYLVQKQAKMKLSDGHLWFSVFKKPTQSSFKRADRVTCCFLLVYLSMFVNILYYDADKSTNTDGISIGPFQITIQQV